MFGDGALTFREFVMREPHPLAMLHDAILEFLRDRDDAVLYGAQAVNAYVDEPRMTQDVDILSTRAHALAQEIRRNLNERFHMAACLRSIREGSGFHIYQLGHPRNRYLVDVRPVSTLPPGQRVDRVLVLMPPELVAMKIISAVDRPKTAKGLIDWADLRRLILRFPELKTETGPVHDRLHAAVGRGQNPAILDAWRQFIIQEVLPEDEDAGF